MDINELSKAEGNDNTVDGFQITEEIKLKLESAAKWAKFIAIVNFVMLGIMVIAGFGAGSLFSSLSGQMEGMNDIPFNTSGIGWIMGFIYLAFALLFFFPVLYLFNFSNKTLKAIEAEDDIVLFDAFSNLNAHYRFMSILLIIMLVLYGISLLGIGIGAMLG